jgi:predicted transcriptional regulator
MQSTLMQLADPNHFIERHDQLALHTGKQREDVLLEALEAYLTQIVEEDARLEAAIAEADRGELVDAEQVHAEAEAMLLARGVTPEQMAAIRAEVFAEMEQAYSISLCE